jgi:hypothetical protein
LRRLVHFLVTAQSLILPVFPQPIPYEAASRWQQRQALFSACQVLEPAFPYLSPTDWELALGEVQPSLCAVPGQVLLTHEGLAQLTYYLAGYVPAR